MIRHIKKMEWSQLLDLYAMLHPDEPDPVFDPALWFRILEDPHQHILVWEEDGQLVGSVTLVIIENLTRGGRPYGIVENLVVLPEHRRKGIACALLTEAVNIAKEQRCYKVEAMSSYNEEAVMNMYAKAGFLPDIKTGLVANLP